MSELEELRRQVSSLLGAIAPITSAHAHGYATDRKLLDRLAVVKYEVEQQQALRRKHAERA